MGKKAYNWQLYIEIEDTGAGIAPEELDTLFEAFVQTETGRESQEGTGLGLPISRQFVRLMGGEMKVESQVGQGTTFKFKIKIKIVSFDEIGNESSKHRVIGLEANQPPYRILIVDDKYNNRYLLLNLLSPLGFEVREASNGQEAIDIWQEWEPHLIWMDIRMPIMDGYEATRRIKETSKGAHTCIIALTASTYEEEHAVMLSTSDPTQLYVQHKYDDFLRKPFRETDIFKMMSKHLGVRYIYEDTSPAPSTNHLEDLDSLSLVNLPPALLDELEKITIQANIMLIEGLIEQIRAIDATIANALAALAEEFEYEQILALIQKSKAL
jgi:CheY-like chemotaxis protein